MTGFYMIMSSVMKGLKALSNINGGAFFTKIFSGIIFAKKLLLLKIS